MKVLTKAFLGVQNEPLLRAFLNLLLTEKEIHDFDARWQAMQLMCDDGLADAEKRQRAMAKKLGISLGKVSRCANLLKQEQHRRTVRRVAKLARR